MNIFNAILQKLGIQKPATPAGVNAHADATVGTHNTPSASAPTTPNSATGGLGSQASTSAHPSATATTIAVSMVDVTNKLDNLARSHPGLDWRVSIADLLQLLDMDNSYEARKALAVELGCPESLMHDSASMNVWLHKTVLQKIAENGGNVPEALAHA